MASELNFRPLFRQMDSAGFGIRECPARMALNARFRALERGRDRVISIGTLVCIASMAVSMVSLPFYPTFYALSLVEIVGMAAILHLFKRRRRRLQKEDEELSFLEEIMET